MVVYKLVTVAVSIILPSYNERENICDLIDNLFLEFKSLQNDLEIIVVDDNSPDGTAKEVMSKFRVDKRVKCFVRDKNKGLANSIKDGIASSCGQIIVVMDTDFNHPPHDAFILYKIAKYVDIAVGSRFIQGGGMKETHRYFLSYLYNIFMRIILRTRLDDNLSGFFAIQRKALFQLDFDKIFWGYGDYYFRLLLQSQKINLKHVQLPVYYGQRKFGIQKTRFLPIFVQYTREVLRVFLWKVRRKW